MRTSRALLFLLLLLAVLPAPAAEPPPKPPRPEPLAGRRKLDLLALFERYAAAKEEERPAILSEARAFDPIPDAAVSDLSRSLFKLAARGPRLDAKRRTLETPDGPGAFLVSGDSGGRRKGLLIGLHGGGEGAGDGATASQKWSPAASKALVCIFPTVLRKEATAWNKEREERWVLALIEAAKRTWPIDTNRVYLVGHSMGGFGTWSIGGHHADLFAAISPNAGGVFVQVNAAREVVGVAPGILPNLLDLPVYFTHGANDPQVAPDSDRAAAKILDRLRTEHPEGYVHEYHEYPDIGHGLPPKGTAEMIEWIAARRRDPCPRKIVWEPTLAWKRLFYWLRLESPAGAGRIVAVNRGENRFEITTEGGRGVRGLSILLNGEMADLRKPVTVSVDGKEVFSGFVLPSAAALLESIVERNDRETVFTARVEAGPG